MGLPQAQPASRTDSMMSAAEDKIRERAYALWLADGMCHGGAERNWLHAEQEIVEEAHVAPKPVLVKPAKPARVGSSGRPDANSGAFNRQAFNRRAFHRQAFHRQGGQAGRQPDEGDQSEGDQDRVLRREIRGAAPLQDRCLQSRHPQADAGQRLTAGGSPSRSPLLLPMKVGACDARSPRARRPACRPSIAATCCSEPWP